MAASLGIMCNDMKEAIDVKLIGEVDISTVSELKEKLYELVEINMKDVRLDCAELNYIDSTGLGALVGVLKKVKNHKKDIYIYNMKSNIEKLFIITGLDKVFIIERLDSLSSLQQYQDINRKQIDLSIMLLPEMVRVVRLTVSVLPVLLGFQIDEIEDIRLLCLKYVIELL